MKFIKAKINLLLLFTVMISFSQCSSTKKLQNSIPFEIGEAYYQYWVSGVKNGDSGINLFIPILSNPNNIVLDSVYFRGQQSKLEIINNNFSVGRFQDYSNRKKDIIMSSEPYAEYGNKTPDLPEKLPFKLKPNECVISYKQEHKTRYFKITGLIKKVELKHPSTSPKKR